MSQCPKCVFLTLTRVFYSHTFIAGNYLYNYDANAYRILL